MWLKVTLPTAFSGIAMAEGLDQVCGK